MTEEHHASRTIVVDWTVPVWGVLGLIVQAAAIVWWGAGIDQRVRALEATGSASRGQSEAIARMDERTRDIVDRMDRIERHLEDKGAK